MRTLRDPAEMQSWALEQRRVGHSIGLVPTMGFLHDGHLSLVKKARASADLVCVSIFVNPTQFGPNEDFSTYPRDWERDEALCRQAGVDLIFAPAPEAVYAADASVSVVEKRLATRLCGASRPGHFEGVCTVVAKLFNLTQPTFAVFGEKDAQQLRIIRRMVRDLNIPVEIVSGPIVRESDGLAMSSRNARLRSDERGQAVCLRRALDTVESAFARGERSADALRSAALAEIARAPLARVDYVDLVDDVTLEPVSRIEAPVLCALAVHFPSARLIDNAVLKG
ncbi:MAG: pantoate--beta-alanine ligase [Verrucomicrobia bacterium]|nr:pantoate--beta-alanine ligase [Kiritimatiellia bacterium]MCO6400793.1 pantoate--beta-alanine ligase [Verrucomicrobiota bacterium]